MVHAEAASAGVPRCLETILELFSLDGRGWGMVRKRQNSTPPTPVEGQERKGILRCSLCPLPAAIFRIDTGPSRSPRFHC